MASQLWALRPSIKDVFESTYIAEDHHKHPAHYHATNFNPIFIDSNI